MSEWSLIFFITDDGDSPVEDFLRGLDPVAQRRFLWSMEQLRLRNTLAREPLVRHLEGKLWELREESRTNIYRLIYCFITGRQIIFLHGFQKKGQKTPPRDLAIARHGSRSSSPAKEVTNHHDE